MEMTYQNLKNKRLDFTNPDADLKVRKRSPEPRFGSEKRSDLWKKDDVSEVPCSYISLYDKKKLRNVCIVYVIDFIGSLIGGKEDLVERT